MSRATHGLILATLLVLAGLAIFTWKVGAFGFPVTPDETSSVWTVQAQIEVDPGDAALKVDLKLPTRTPGYDLTDEHFISRGFGVAVDDDPWQRSASWTQRRAANRQTLFYRSVFYQNDRPVELAPTPRFPSPPALEEPFQTALTEIVDEVRSESADVVSFAAQVLVQLNDPAPDDNMALFLEGPLGLDRAHIARLIMSAARIPVIMLNGIDLGAQSRDAQFETLIAVHDGSNWTVFDPRTADRGLPSGFLVWYTGDDPLVSTAGADLRSVRISVRERSVSALDLATERAETAGSKITEFSLLALPLDLQAVYEILLLIPVGAFMIALLRNVVGLRSFGTFMPVLIAIAFRETQLVAGIILFTLVVGVGLLFRFYLEKLRLLLVPRLSAVLIIVVMLMAVVSVLSQRLGLQVGLSVALFPMVIVAMVIERMSVVWEEQSPADALLDGAGSLFIAALAYLVMGIDLFAWWVLVFPELLLVLLGLTIALGRYTGYRLTELVRFRELAK
ncbi:inactive transglutaminase family protein [Halomonas denitrificans]|nr:inactive transglutaminase family protein [Halomonas denitrificans]